MKCAVINATADRGLYLPGPEAVWSVGALASVVEGLSRVFGVKRILVMLSRQSSPSELVFRTLAAKRFAGIIDYAFVDHAGDVVDGLESCRGEDDWIFASKVLPVYDQDSFLNDISRLTPLSALLVRGDQPKSERTFLAVLDGQTEWFCQSICRFEFDTSPGTVATKDDQLAEICRRYGLKKELNRARHLEQITA